MQIVGPDCLGVMVPVVGLNTSIAPVTPNAGHLAFVAQSGGVVATVLDWAKPRGIGFSHFASLGDMCNVDFGDLLDYLAGEIDVRGILMCPHLLARRDGGSRSQAIFRRAPSADV